MIHRETESPLLGGNRDLWDLQPDLLMSQAYQQEIVDVLGDTELLLGTMPEHSGGMLTQFEEHVGNTRFVGYLLQTAPIFNQDVSLTRAYSGTGDIIYALTAWEYADGAKAVLGETNVVVSPRIEDKHIFIDRRPDGVIEYLARLAYQNVISPSEATTLSPDEQKKVYDTKVDFDQFSIYSLYKINKLLNILRADSHLA
jgi:hypothetical protein